MKKLLGFAITLSFLIAGCGKEETLKQQQGLIVDIKVQPGWGNQMLVIPNVTEEDISNMKMNELVEFAQEKGGAYYGFDVDKYEELEVGDHVIVYWDGPQFDSSPPQRGLDKIDILSKSTDY